MLSLAPDKNVSRHLAYGLNMSILTDFETYVFRHQRKIVLTVILLLISVLLGDLSGIVNVLEFQLPYSLIDAAQIVNVAGILILTLFLSAVQYEQRQLQKSQYESNVEVDYIYPVDTELTTELAQKDVGAEIVEQLDPHTGVLFFISNYGRGPANHFKARCEIAFDPDGDPVGESTMRLRSVYSREAEYEGFTFPSSTRVGRTGASIDPGQRARACVGQLRFPVKGQGFENGDALSFQHLTRYLCHQSGSTIYIKLFVIYHDYFDNKQEQCAFYIRAQTTPGESFKQVLLKGENLGDIKENLPATITDLNQIEH